MAYDKTLSEVVERVVKERFSDAVINSVEIKMDVDSDGDPVLLVTVVFDANNLLFVFHKTASQSSPFEGPIKMGMPRKVKYFQSLTARIHITLDIS